MANIIAVIWDCDRTLIDGYMQDPILKHNRIAPEDFWPEVNSIPKKIEEEKKIRVNKDTYYLNEFIRRAKEGNILGLDNRKLNNQKLREFGKLQKFYPGIPEIFKKTKEMFHDNPSYSEYGIQVEHYIVSTGFAEVIRGSKIMPYVDGIWGCELLDAPDPDGNPVLSEVVYTIDNTTKTRAIFEINKGIQKMPEIDVNSTIPKDMRRVRFENMIYIADGPSDIPAFSVVRQYGGSTFAIYPKGDKKAMQQVEQMRANGRIDMYAEADYSENTTAYLWITGKIEQLAETIQRKEREKIRQFASKAPQHLI